MKSPKILSILLCLTLLAGVFGGCTMPDASDSDASYSTTSAFAADTTADQTDSDTKPSATASEQYDSDNCVYFIDVGQGDSECIISGGRVTLIDAGTSAGGDSVVSLLKSLGISKIDSFIISHPHADHIGGAVKVLKNFDVTDIYMRRPTEGTEPTTSTYEKFLLEVASQNKTITAVTAGMTADGGNFELTFLGPLHDYEDMNAQSAVVRAELGKISFLFTGDSESECEKDELEKYGGALESTVLKIGHHGSRYASSADFLAAVSPEYSVISCGVDNTYGHPHDETLVRLGKLDTTVLRTDISGTITFTTDGKTVEYTTEKK